jgi:hypothetical protein
MAANNGNVVAIGGNGTPTVHSSLQGQRWPKQIHFLEHRIHG